MPRTGEKQTPPPEDPKDSVPQPKREPDWDLDPSDPARDYVRRYVWSTPRYGDARKCVDAQPSTTNAGKVEVRVTDATPPTCPQPSGVDETYVVDVGQDHLELPHPQEGRTHLERWPDGSDPLGPPAKQAPEFDKVNNWTTPAGRVLQAEKLVPIRIQLYGRGTYPFVTLAGFPTWFPRTADVGQRNALAAKICAASAGLPLAIAGGLDRSNVLQIKCGASPTTSWVTF